MKLLFSTLWNYNDALSITTVLPHVEILAGFPEVEQIFLITGEQAGFDGKLREPLPAKTVHLPFIPKGGGIPGLSRLMEVFEYADWCANIARKEKVALMMFRGTTAGSGGYLAWRKTRIPYTVESFEPHAAYMYECGVWSKWGPKYQLQAWWEERQKKTAAFIIPCAHNYSRALEQEGVPASRLKVIPCCIPLNKFAFSAEKRKAVRSALGIPENAVAGIYLGKFGGVYYTHDSFRLFAKAFREFGDRYYQIILTPNSPQELEPMMDSAGIPKDRVIIRFVENKQVPDFLSASDFAYSPIVYSPSQKHRSLIKNGEYWANGLPIIQTDEVGDDYLIIEKEEAGANFRVESESSMNEAFLKIKTILQADGHRERIARLAARERDFSLAVQVYREIIKPFNKKQ